jgi:hypothetical protein
MRISYHFDEYSRVRLNGQFGRNGLGQKVTPAWIETGNFVMKIAHLKVTNSLREYWSHFKAKKQGFQRRLNEVLETARTYVFQFRDN